MASVHFHKDTKFVRTFNNSESTGIRLYRKESKDGKSYWEGAVQLDNGQYVWFTVFGSMTEHDTKNGGVYIGGQCKITAPATARKRNW